MTYKIRATMGYPQLSLSQPTAVGFQQLAIIKTRRPSHTAAATLSLHTMTRTHAQLQGLTPDNPFPVTCSAAKSKLRNLELISHLEIKAVLWLLSTIRLNVKINLPNEITAKKPRRTVSAQACTKSLNFTKTGEKTYWNKSCPADAIYGGLKQTITSLYLKRRAKTGAIKSVQLPCSKKLARASM